MQRLTGTFSERDVTNANDEWHKIELPDRGRNSTYTAQNEKESLGPSSPELASPGLESVLQEQQVSEKEIADPAPQYQERPSRASTVKPKRSIRAITIAAILILAVLGIGLGVGLGVGLTRHRQRRQPVSAPMPNYFSQIGAFNGSGIALASESFASTDHGSIVMYFQHHSGQIRQAQLGSDGNWKGGDATNIVALDAKNGTPIAAVAYARDNIAAWHIFFIGTNGTIREVTNSNVTNVWTPGPINDLGLRPMDDPNVGLQACWYGSFYSDVAYKHSPVPGQSDKGAGNSSDQTVGIHLWYGANSTAFNSVGWTYGDAGWSEQQYFNGFNGHGGVGCYSWGPGSVTYVFFVNLQNEINILWKDLNTTTKGNNTHPINTWTPTNVSIPVFANTSIGYTNYLYAQNADLSVSGYNVSWDAENTTIPAAGSNGVFKINGPKALPNTHLSVTALPDSSGGNSLLAFYQTNGSDITEFVRDLDAGQWTSSEVPIPNQ